MGDAIQTGTVYVRDAVPDDFDPITRLLTRAFLHDPLIHWFGSFSAPIPMPDIQEIWGERSTKLPKDIELIYHVRYAFLVSVYLDHGHIIVCVRRETDNSEKILSIAAWLPHRNRCDGTSAVRKSKLFLKVIFGTWRRPGGWGLSGLKRIFFQALPAMDELFLDASKITGLLPEEIWTLSNVATDPNESGKGYCKMVLEYGFKRVVGNRPVYLHVTTAKAKDMYNKMGFEVTGSLTLGAGEVTELGLTPVNKNIEHLVGVRLWAMVRLPTPVLS